jgi:hypothetical protein
MSALGAVVVLVLLVGAVGGFVVGWVAHGDDLARYTRHRRRYLTEHEPRPATAAVVYVPVPTPVMVPGPAWAPPIVTHDRVALSPLSRSGERPVTWR